MEEQFILRAPTEELASVLRKFVRGEETDVQISLQPADGGSDRFLLTVAEKRYMVSMVTLPTVVETAKPGDVNRGIVYKTGEVGRMLYVHPEPLDSDTGSAKMSSASNSATTSSTAANDKSGGAPEKKADAPKLIAPQPVLVPNPAPYANPGERISDSGLAPPTAHIVQRKFQKAHQYISKYSKDEIREVERVLIDLRASTSGSYEHVVEQLVDAESWMGPSFQYGGDHLTLVYEDGQLADLYQMQHEAQAQALGLRESFHRRKQMQGAPKPVRPNEDGTFGKPATAEQMIKKPHAGGPEQKGTAAAHVAASAAATEEATAPLSFGDLAEELGMGLIPELDGYGDDGYEGDDIFNVVAPGAGDQLLYTDGASSGAGVPWAGALMESFTETPQPESAAATTGEPAQETAAQVEDAAMPASTPEPAEAPIEDSAEIQQQVKRVEELTAAVAALEKQVNKTTIAVLRARQEKSLADKRAELAQAEAELASMRASR